MSDNNRNTDEELRERVALSLRVLFPLEAWETYVRSAVCVIHEVQRPAPKEKPKENWCCHIGCGEHAEWRIQDEPATPDNYTETCSAHVGVMLSGHHTIYPIEVSE